MRTFNDISTIYVKKDSAYNNGFSPVFSDFGYAESNPGPVSSIQRAVEIASEMRENGWKRPLKIRIFSGEYEFSNPLVLSNLCSDITFEAYGDGPVVISGGRKIEGFHQDIFNGKSCFSAFIPEVKNGSWNFTDLYVNGKRADLTRYPKEGFFSIIEPENKSGDLFAHSKWFIAHKEDLNSIRNIRDCILSFCHYWIDEHTPIEDYDPETGKLIMTYASMFNLIGDEFRYYLENVSEMFAKPNEWYLDRPNGMLYYIPRDEEMTPENIEVHAPVAKQLIITNGVRNVRFRDIKFAYTRGEYSCNQNVDGKVETSYASDAQAVSNAHGSIELNYTKDCSIENCSVMNYGVHGVTVNKGCSGIRITGCDFIDGGAGGIKISGGAAGCPVQDCTFGCVFSDNRILHCGRRYLSACGILLMNAFSCEISHNEIADLYYTGISSGWVWGYAPSNTHDILILKNHIHDLGQGRLSDMGGVYLLGAQPGTVVSGNLIHDVKCRQYGGWALYTDEGSASITLENNICYNTSSNMYHQHYGTNNVVRNNIFAFSESEMLAVSRFEYHNSITFENNILYSKGSCMLNVNERHIDENTVLLNRNLYFDCTKDAVMKDRDGYRSLSELQAKGADVGSLITDPLFEDAEHYDFTLKPDSPAFKLGFKAIDIHDVGVRR